MTSTLPGLMSTLAILLLSTLRFSENKGDRLIGLRRLDGDVNPVKPEPRTVEETSAILLLYRNFQVFYFFLKSV